MTTIVGVEEAQSYVDLVYRAYTGQYLREDVVRDNLRMLKSITRFIRPRLEVHGEIIDDLDFHRGEYRAAIEAIDGAILVHAYTSDGERGLRESGGDHPGRATNWATCPILTRRMMRREDWAWVQPEEEGYDHPHLLKIKADDYWDRVAPELRGDHDDH